MCSVVIRKLVDCFPRFTTAKIKSVDSIMSCHLLLCNSEISLSSASPSFTGSSLNGSSMKHL